jgi:hypothetical protein
MAEIPEFNFFDGQPPLMVVERNLRSINRLSEFADSFCTPHAPGAVIAGADGVRRTFNLTVDHEKSDYLLAIDAVCENRQKESETFHFKRIRTVGRNTIGWYFMAHESSRVNTGLHRDDALMALAIDTTEMLDRFKMKEAEAKALVEARHG